MHDQSSPGHAYGAEEWRPVVGAEGRYEVSSLGRVRSLVTRYGGVIRRRPEPLVLRTQPNRGYLHVSVASRSRTGHRSRKVHRLVLEAFVGPCPDGCEAAHLNGKRDDNRAENLAWKTHEVNNQDKLRHGTSLRGDQNPSRVHPERMRRGARHGQAKLTEADVPAIRAAWKAGESQTRIGARYGVSRRSIGNLVSGKTWGHVE